MSLGTHMLCFFKNCQKRSMLNYTSRNISRHLMTFPLLKSGRKKRHCWFLCSKLSTSTKTVDVTEAEKFSQLGSKWWDISRDSSVKLLHSMKRIVMDVKRQYRTTTMFKLTKKNESKCPKHRMHKSKQIKCKN